MRARLRGVEGERKVRRERELRIIGTEVDRNPLEGGEVRRCRELRVEAADRKGKVRMVAPAGAQRDVPADRPAEETRVRECCVYRERAGIEVDDSDEVDVEDEDGALLGRECGTHLTQDENPYRASELDDDADLAFDESWGAVGNPRHGAKEICAFLRREDRGHVMEDP